MKRNKLRINPKLRNHCQFQKLFAQWKKQNPLNDVERFNTRDFPFSKMCKALELASLENWSISSSSLYYRSLGFDIPSSETILDCCHQEGEEIMFAHLNTTLEAFFQDLPGKIRRQFRKSGIRFMGIQKHQISVESRPSGVLTWLIVI